MPAAYGLMGAGTMPSCLGDSTWSPYALEEAAKTTRLIPAARTASSTVIVPLTLTSWLVAGSSTLRGTEPRAAS